MTEFFESPFRILQLRSGQDGELLDIFAQQLRQSGFAKITARRHLRAAEHLLYWAKRKGVSPATFDEGTLEDRSSSPPMPLQELRPNPSAGSAEGCALVSRQPSPRWVTGEANARSSRGTAGIVAVSRLDGPASGNM